MQQHSLSRDAQPAVYRGGRRLTGIGNPSTEEPLVSIITVVYNGEKTLERTIASVLSQTYRSIEFIICDGGSTDNTVKILLEYEQAIDYWFSEPDRGIYHAMNKGIQAATGQWLLFLGADDCLYQPEAIAQLICHTTPDSMLVFGDAVYDNGNYFKSKLDFRTLLSNTVHHQASLYNAQLFQNFRYDETCRAYADYELNLIIYLNRYRTHYLNQVIARCGSEGVTSILQQNAETNYLRGKHVSIPLNLILKLLLPLLDPFLRFKSLLKTMLPSRSHS